MADLLSAWGYEVEAAPDGVEALEKIPSFDPAVIISDLRMPRMGGMELLKQVRDSRLASSFIMLTAQGTIEEAVEATKLGAFNFLEKPVDTKRLQVELRNSLERHESERRVGCFELADEGTLLLDEIGEMPVATQAKLLRVLEDSKVRRLGSKSEISVNVRVLAATNKVPEEAVAKGQLRRDLFFRLNVVNIAMPPLRDHLEDLPEVVEALLQDLNRKHSRSVNGVEDDVLEIFRRYSWPGNVRELRNTLERAVVVCRDEMLRKKDLSPGFGAPPRPDVDDGLRLRPGMPVAEAERRLIYETLAFTQNNKTRAAEMLGISLKTLHNKLKEYESQPQG